MKAYHVVYINYEQYQTVKCFSKAKVVYIDIKNTSINYTLFELNCN